MPRSSLGRVVWGGCVSYVVIKVDMSKAYDRVEWSFVDHVMDMMGFGSRWRSQILNCIFSASYYVLINKVSHPTFLPQRELRQVDPLFPYLFLLCVDYRWPL